MVCCFVPNCPTGKSIKENTHIFRASKDVAEEWVNIMKVLRSDKIFDPTNRNHGVCSLHFKEEDILKVSEFLIKGEYVEFPRDRWALVKGAIPTLFTGISEQSPYIQALTTATKRKYSNSGGVSNRPTKRKRGSGTSNPCEPSKLTDLQSVKSSSTSSLTENIDTGKGKEFNNLTLEGLVQWWNKKISKEFDGWVLDGPRRGFLLLHSVDISDSNGRPISYKTITITASSKGVKVAAYFDKIDIVEETEVFTREEFFDVFKKINLPM